MDNYSVGLSWPTFFMPRNHKIDEVNEKFKEFAQENSQYNSSNLVGCFRRYDYDCTSDENELFKIVVFKVVFKWCLVESDFAITFLEEDEYIKCKDLYKRKQYSSMKFEKLVSIFISLLSYLASNEIIKNDISHSLAGDLFRKDIMIEIEILRNEKFVIEFLPLIKVVNIIASGVKKECYLRTRNYSEVFNGEVIAFVKEKFNYDLSLYSEYGIMGKTFYNSFYKDIEKIFKFLLLNDKAFWESKEEFNVLSFLSIVHETHGVKHVLKIVDYIMIEAQKNEWYNEFIMKGLIIPTETRDSIMNGLIERSYDSAFGTFGEEFYDNIKELTGYMVYPIEKTCANKCNLQEIRKAIDCGKILFDKFINAIYPNDIDKISNYFADFHNCILEDSTTNYRKELTIAKMFDKDVLGYVPNINDVELVKVLDESFINDENIWNRVYLKCYLVSCAVDEDKINHYLYEVFYGLFKIIDEVFNINTTMQKDMSLRNSKFDQLSKVMLGYDMNISESSYKNLYINALLDRKMAMIDEVEIFPELEQLGDAIYGFALSELIFYNPKGCEDDILRKKWYNDKISSIEKAEFQVQISKELGFDKTYIGTSVHLYKYDNDFDESNKYDHCSMSYLADSLEMIIAVVSREFGLSKAVEFAKKLISNLDEELGDELKESDASKCMLMSNVHICYWKTIHPGMFSEKDHDHYRHWYAIDKLLRTCIIGTNTVEKRQNITNSSTYDDFYKALAEEESNYHHNFNYTINPVYFDYLNNDIQYVIDKYKKMFNVELSEL